jgi:small subunit ribosomal protein S13
MARIAGIDLPKNKKIGFALIYLYGVGRPLAAKIMKAVEGQIDPNTRVKDLTEAQAGLLNTIVTKDFKVEGELRREVTAHIRHYTDINSYRGLRHRRNLPVRGQRTKTNARTRRGRRKTVGGQKAAEAK